MRYYWQLMINKNRNRMIRLFAKIILLFSALLAIFSCSPAHTGSLPPGATPPTAPILVIGHRGSAGLAPENTLKAFHKACELGVDAVELDVFLTRDRQIAVYHDYALKPEITRMPDGKWLQESGPAINTLTLGELKTYDVGRLKPGTRYARRYPEQMAVDGERIPTLDGVINLMKGNCSPTTEMWVEIKTNPEKPALTPAPETVADAVVRVLRKQSFSGRARILSFDWRALAHVQKIAPEIPTVYLSLVGVRLNNIQPGRPGASPWMAGLDIDDFNGSIPRAVVAAGGRFWAPYYKHLSARQLQEAHGLELRVFVWTPDSPPAMQLLIDRQVDGIITNRPDLLKKLLSR